MAAFSESLYLYIPYAGFYGPGTVFLAWEIVGGKVSPFAWWSDVLETQGLRYQNCQAHLKRFFGQVAQYHRLCEVRESEVMDSTSEETEHE